MSKQLLEPLPSLVQGLDTPLQLCETSRDMGSESSEWAEGDGESLGVMSSPKRGDIRGLQHSVDAIQSSVGMHTPMLRELQEILARQTLDWSSLPLEKAG